MVADLKLTEWFEENWGYKPKMFLVYSALIFAYTGIEDMVD
jgi:hypothetical protein